MHTVIGVDLQPGQPKVCRCPLVRAKQADLRNCQGFEEDAPHTHDLVQRDYGVKSAFVQGDVTLEETWEKVMRTALELTGRVDM